MDRPAAHYECKCPGADYASSGAQASPSSPVVRQAHRRGWPVAGKARGAARSVTEVIEGSIACGTAVTELLKSLRFPDNGAARVLGHSPSTCNSARTRSKEEWLRELPFGRR